MPKKGEKFQSLLVQGKRAVDDLAAVASSVGKTQSYASDGDTFPFVFAYEVTIEDGSQRVGFSLSK